MLFILIVPLYSMPFQRRFYGVDEVSFAMSKHTLDTPQFHVLESSAQGLCSFLSRLEVRVSLHA